MNFEEIFYAVVSMFETGVPMTRVEMVYACLCAIVIVGLVSMAIGLILVVTGGNRKPNPTYDPHKDDWRRWN